MSTNSFHDVTILLQGVLHKDISLTEILDSYTKYCNVILSIYDTDYETIEPIARNYNNVTIIKNNLESFTNVLRQRNQLSPHPYYNNSYYQIRTTLAGLEHVTSPYVLKSRIDHFYEGIDDFIKMGLEKDKVISSSLFVRGYSLKPYHLSDCLFMGKKDSIQKGYSYAERTFHESWPEYLIWKSYFTVLSQELHIDLNSLNEGQYYEFMDKHVHIYCINKFSKFYLKFKDIIITQSNDNEKSTLDYLRHGCSHTQPW